MKNRNIDSFVVIAEQMQNIEERLFQAGFPVAALMEKVAGLATQKILQIIADHYQPNSIKNIGMLVGPGHNGGDALVIARELFFQGYTIKVYCPFQKLKELTASHSNYVKSLGVNFTNNPDDLKNCDLLIDGLFGFGLERAITGELADHINLINSWHKLIFSIDLPSGIHTDTGAVLGTAIQAEYTFCLGLYKLGLLQEQAADYVGNLELIDFQIPLADIQAILGEVPPIQNITASEVAQYLPLPRPRTNHKYKNGHVLIIAGSQSYTGAAILAGLGARASGAGMVSIAVPESIKPILNHHLPEALIIGCPETATGAISSLPAYLDLTKYRAIACGPGLTRDAKLVVEQVLTATVPLILDADALNILADQGLVNFSQRSAPTLMTPHTGELKRLFPQLQAHISQDRVLATQEVAKISGAITLLKGARTIIADQQNIWINTASTPALARGGSGDVLTGLIAGLWAIAGDEVSLINMVNLAVWLHSQAALLGVKERTELGIDAFTLTSYLIPAIQALFDFTKLNRRSIIDICT
jgi:NAD(P)H-hydrate epimerase